MVNDCSNWKIANEKEKHPKKKRRRKTGEKK